VGQEIMVVYFIGQADYIVALAKAATGQLRGRCAHNWRLDQRVAEAAVRFGLVTNFTN
jgi:hypothetical protein